MHEWLSTSQQVSPNNIFGTREGQSLPEFRKQIDYRRRWDESYNYPWPKLKAIWMQYWAHYKPLLLDKSPPNLIRTTAILQHFRPAQFIIMVRNPYVHCEALIRRDGMTAQKAGERAIQCLKHQKQNLDVLEKDSLLIRYEDLVGDPSRLQQQLIKFIPELYDIQLKSAFKAHNAFDKAMPITDMNMGKIERLDREDLAVIQKVFEPEALVLQRFGYPLLDLDKVE